MKNNEHKENNISNILSKYQELKKMNKDELRAYYGKLRDMLESFNRLILDASIRGATVILAVAVIATYFTTRSGIINSLLTLLVVVGATFLCHNLKAQVDFFAGMLRSTVHITEKVEALLLSYRKNDKEEVVPYDLLVTHDLRTNFPGSKYVKQRQRFYNLFLWVLYILIAVSLGQFIYQVINENGVAKVLLNIIKQFITYKTKVCL